jgi:hypothetical protein
MRNSFRFSVLVFAGLMSGEMAFGQCHSGASQRRGSGMGGGPAMGSNLMSRMPMTPSMNSMNSMPSRNAMLQSQQPMMPALGSTDTQLMRLQAQQYYALQLQQARLQQLLLFQMNAGVGTGTNTQQLRGGR